MRIRGEVANFLLGSSFYATTLLGPGVVGAYLGYEAGKISNDAKPEDVAGAERDYNALIDDYLDLAPIGSCGRIVLATIQNQTDSYQDSSSADEIGESMLSACGETPPETVLEAAEEKLNGVQIAKRTFHEVSIDSRYSTREKLIHSFAGFIGGYLAVAAAVGLYKGVIKE